MTQPLEGEALVIKAAQIAEKAHEGQAHHFGNDSYFKMHLEPIANIVRRMGYGALYVAGGYLHDIKEDTTITDEELIAEGMPLELVQAMNIIGKIPGQLHEDYMAGILLNKIAIVDKFADSSFNFAWTILNSSKSADQNFIERALEYSANIALLRHHLPHVDK